MAWLARNNFVPSDFVHADDLNNLANDIRTWGGNVNGGGFTLSNVTIIEATTRATPVLSWNTRVGDVMPQAGDYTVSMITGAVPNTVQVIAGAGLTGGGPLTSNVTLNAQVTSVFGRTGAVTLVPNDLAGAGAVPSTRNINTGTGLTGGGNLSGDLTLAQIPNSVTQLITAYGNGAQAGVRPAINFINGANVVISVSDNASQNRIDISVASSGGGSGGGMIDPTTALGDLIVRGTAAPSRLPVGANGYVLIISNSVRAAVSANAPSLICRSSSISRTCGLIQLRKL